MRLALVAVSGLLLASLGFFRWRWAVIAVLVLVVTEGALRKWIFPEVANYIYFAKDFVLLAAYAGFCMENTTRSTTVSFGLFPVVLSVAALIVGLQVFNSRLGEPLIGLFGFKAYLIYAPLSILVPYLFADTRDLERFLKYYSLLVIPVCFLGMVQFARPGDNMLNQYVAVGDTAGSIATFGVEGDVRARVTGTFSYISGMVTYLVVGAVLVIPSFARRSSLVWFQLAIVEFILICGTILMTGSRAPFWMVLTILAGFFMLAGVGAISGAATRLRGALLLVGVGTLFTVSMWFQPAYDAFVHRMTNASDAPWDRIFQHSADLGGFIDAAGLQGYGAGATHPGSDGLRQAFGLSESLLAPPDSEAEYVRVLLELGVVGAAIWYVMRLYLLAIIFQTWLRLNDPYLRSMALGIFLFQLVNLSGVVVLNHTMGVYYWFLAGFCFLLPRLDSNRWRHQPAEASFRSERGSDSRSTQHASSRPLSRKQDSAR
jgi:hypothetical protein